MYHNYFGLKEQAFSIAVNPRYLYMSKQHKEALAHLLYGVKGGGFVLLSGEVGTGKTTIVKCLLEQLPEKTDIAIVLNPMADVADMLCVICEELGIDYDKTRITIKTLTDALYKYLLNNHRQARNTVLLIDEAQLLSEEALEQIRLLTNLETSTQKLLQIILVGQPELNELLARPQMRQLSQRITARFHLMPLTLGETQAYIRHRLAVAGMPEGRSPYPPAIINKIHSFTGGVPRLINIVCERMLIGAYGHNKPIIDQHIFKLACSEVAGSMEQQKGRLKHIDRRILAGTGSIIALLLVIIVWQAMTKPVPQQSPSIPEADNPISQAPASIELLAARTAPTAIPEAALTAAVQPQNSMPMLSEGNGASVANTLDYRTKNYAEAQYNLLTHLGFEVSSETHPCWELTKDRIQCKNTTLETWSELRALNRPAVLILTTPERFTSHATVVGLGETEAEVINSQGETVLVPLTELGPLWTGEVFYIWKRPRGFVEPLVVGQRNSVIQWLAEQFAILDGHSDPLTNKLFTATMQRRVKIFQRSHGLKDDGIVGEQTLMKVNEVMGIDQSLKLLDN